MIDFKSIPVPNHEGRNNLNRASDEEVLKVATGMAKIGYRFSAASTRALTEVLSGNSVMIYGPCGTGKSVFFKVLSEYSPYLERNGIPNRPYKFAVVRLGFAVTRPVAEVEKFVMYHDEMPLVLDDLGSEAISVDYGRRLEVADIILQHRELTKQCTHVISNFNEEELMQRYGSRVVDRLHYTVPPIEFSGSSTRSPHGRIPLESTDWYRMFGYWQPRN